MKRHHPLTKKKPVYRLNGDDKPELEYPSIWVAAKENNISVSSIVNCLAKRQKTAAGYKWKYK